MQQTVPYAVKIDEQNVVVSFDRTLLDQVLLFRLLDYLRIATVRQQSQATQEEVDRLAAEVNAKIWQRLKPQVLPGS